MNKLNKILISFAAGSCLLLSACLMDDERLVGRWTLINDLSCPDYKEKEAAQQISMLRFNQNGDWALSYEDGKLIFKGTYSASPEADGATDYSAKLQLNVDSGPADLAAYKLNGSYSISENYLTLHDIWLTAGASAKGCGHSFKRR